MDRLAGIAADHSLHMVVGVVERDGGTLYCTALFFSRDDVVSTGGSCFIGPLGRVLAGPARDGEEILFADLDLDEIARAKFDFDVVGHYARPDVFSLLVDTRAKNPVDWLTVEPRAGA